jgi:hypothetical protein
MSANPPLVTFVGNVIGIAIGMVLYSLLLGAAPSSGLNSALVIIAGFGCTIYAIQHYGDKIVAAINEQTDLIANDEDVGEEVPVSE